MELVKIFLYFNYVLILFEQVTTSEDEDEEEEAAGTTKSYSFIIPEELSENQYLFLYDNKIEYIISANELSWEEAVMSCKFITSKPGVLAIVDDESKLQFLAEALTETNKRFDNLWIAGRERHGSWTYGFSYNNSNRQLPQDLLDKYNTSRIDLTVNLSKQCLSFSIKHHQTPTFIDLNCLAQRSYICQREAENIPTVPSGSTHPGWIKMERRAYKIFYDRTTWDNATERCYRADQKARLAVLSNYKDAHDIGRYLIIGRPALENAWIGAKYDEDSHSYVFKDENIVLSNTTNQKTQYPPWRLNKTQKERGCLLLDKHTANMTLFIEARCGRHRPYICYKIIDETEPTFIRENHFYFGNALYILHFNRSNFEQANRVCARPLPLQNFTRGKLAQPKNTKEMQQLLYIMGENRTSTRHIWIGAKFFNNTSWWWLKKRNKTNGPYEEDVEVPSVIENNYPPWIINGTYVEDVENMNTCLNMDRENHNTGLFYGTDCSYPQSFICQYSKITSHQETTTVESGDGNTDSEEVDLTFTDGDNKVTDATTKAYSKTTTSRTTQPEDGNTSEEVDVTDDRTSSSTESTTVTTTTTPTTVTTTSSTTVTTTSTTETTTEDLEGIITGIGRRRYG